MGSTPIVEAADITRTYEVTANDFVAVDFLSADPPVGYVQGALGPYQNFSANYTVTFDPLADQTPTISGFEINHDSLPYSSQFQFNLGDDDLTIATLPFTASFGGTIASLFHDKIDTYGTFIENPAGTPSDGGAAYTTANGIIYVANSYAAWLTQPVNAYQALINFKGGTLQDPVSLDGYVNISKITGTLSADNSVQWYQFETKGGAFQATASIADAPPNASYEFELANGLGIPVEEITLDQANNFTAQLYDVLTCGNTFDLACKYDIGVVADSPNDPAFAIDFTTPVGGGVPEPATWAMILIGFVGVGAAMRAGGRKSPASHETRVSAPVYETLEVRISGSH